MMALSRGIAAFAGLGLAAAFIAPASAQYANEYTPPKLAHFGKTSKPIAGTGMVVIQVQVNANGTHHVVRVIKSTNSGDNAAAMDIAQNSSYRPGMRGKTRVTAFYDFTLKFNGKTVAAAQQQQGSVTSSKFTGVEGQIDRLIRAGKYEAAKSRAEAVSNPSDVVNAELGAANYFLADYPAAAAAFSKVGTLNPEFKQVAANAFMQASVKTAASNPAIALAYAQKAAAISPTGGSYYALGNAELAQGNASQAVVDLKRARDLIFADPKADVKVRVNVDSQLYSAYVKAGDSAQAASLLDEIKRLDPNNTSLSTIQANNYISQGQALQKAGKYDEAIAAFEQAAAQPNPDAQVTGNLSAAFALGQKLGQQNSNPKVADYVRMQSYADKVLAIRPNDPQANFAEGIALTGQYQLGGKSDSSLKAKALAALNKAKSEAQSSSNMTLSIQIDNFIKQSQLQ